MPRDLEQPDQRRLYGDLAWTWRIISPPEDCVEEAEEILACARASSKIQVNTLLDLGCGAGHTHLTWKKYVEVTGVDITRVMLESAERLNPEVIYLEGDMRTVRLEKLFDMVTITDSIDYMLSPEDLRAAFTTAFLHLKPGGILITYVIRSPERFEQNWNRCSSYHVEDKDLTLLENYYDPDPSDTTYEMTYVFLIRHHGHLDIEIDRHLNGLFDLGTWRSILERVGFKVNQAEIRIYGFPMFICLKPSQSDSPE